MVTDGSEGAMNTSMETVITISPSSLHQTAASALPECRICQEEDDPSQLEAPCDCSGTLKFAHRECVQRWCNEKGDTLCEICLQPFKQGYHASPFRHPAERVTLDISDTWEIELRDPRIIALAAAQRHLLESDFEEITAMDTRSAACCRSIVLIVRFLLAFVSRRKMPLAMVEPCYFLFILDILAQMQLMALLLLRHATAMSSAADDGDPILFFVILVLRLLGLLLPCYIMIRALNMLRQRHSEQVTAPTGTGLSVVLRGGQPQSIRVAFVPSVDLP